MDFNGFQVMRRTVTGVAVPSILRKFYGAGLHQYVAVMLRDDGGGRNRQAPAVAFHDGFYSAGQFRRLVAVDPLLIAPRLPEEPTNDRKRDRHRSNLIPDWKHSRVCKE